MMEAIKQPVINGYFMAGSFVGPGGLQMVKASLLKGSLIKQLGTTFAAKTKPFCAEI